MMGPPSQPAGTVPQRQLAAAYRLAAVAGAILLLAGGFVGALRTPGVLGLVGYGVSAVVAASIGRALHVATRRNRGYQSTQTTSLAAGLFVLVAVVDVVMIVVAVAMGGPATSVDLRLGVLLVTVLLALVIGAMGIFGVARPMAAGEATPRQEAQVIEDATHRAEEHRQDSWAHARRDQGDP